MVRGGPTIYYGAKRGVYTILAKNHTFFHCFEDCERRRVAVALGFWEACGSHVGRMILRGFGLMSNIDGDRVWSRGTTLVYMPFYFGAKRGEVCFSLDVVRPRVGAYFILGSCRI